MMPEIDSMEEDPKFKFRAAVVLLGVGGLSMMSGFGFALSSAKKKDLKYFNKGFIASKHLPESGVYLASRALAMGSMYAISGVSLLCFAVWKLSGAQDLKEFRHMAGRGLPVIPRSDPPRGRTEFSGLNDLLQYVMDEDTKAKGGGESEIFSKRND